MKLKGIMHREKGILIDLYDDEEVVSVIRKHWFAFIGTIVTTSILIIAFFIGSIILHSVISSRATAEGSRLISDNLGLGAFIVFGSVFLLSVLGFFYIAWLDYYLDVFILTNKRILRFEQLVLFGQKLSETSFQHVQDVSSQVKGFLQTILSVGTVFVETAGENENFSFPAIKSPGRVAAQILELQKGMWDDDKIRGGVSNSVKQGKIMTMNGGVKKSEDAIEIPIEFPSVLEAPLAANNTVVEEAKEVSLPNPEPVVSSVPCPEISKIDDKINQLLGLAREEESVIADSSFTPETDGREAKIEISPTIKRPDLSEEKPTPSVANGHYKDGRKITPNGVIWQADQEISVDILEVLNKMED